MGGTICSAVIKRHDTTVRVHGARYLQAEHSVVEMGRLIRGGM
jgi:hypothetical protein